MKTLTWNNLCRAAVACLAIGTAQLGQAALPALIESDQISGDWGSRRTTWSDRGYDFTFEYIGETISNTGGTRTPSPVRLVYSRAPTGTRTTPKDWSNLRYRTTARTSPIRV